MLEVTLFFTKIYQTKQSHSPKHQQGIQQGIGRNQLQRYTADKVFNLLKGDSMERGRLLLDKLFTYPYYIMFNRITAVRF
ncbi:hypothetical protein PEPS_11500 [Persicobacter psychrovividus]|uniref:Uncharacterized protein n=1 Tax=Persicobacter psychrovividus TaxID=387638 RepID=A0ABM7VD60_9BACT|nr:hypothetical protein PEPS_11500 [Persicobacter psychrovividus]